MDRSRRVLLAALAAAGCAPAALGQDRYPSRPIRLIVSFAAGTGGDALARIVGTTLGQQLGQPVVVDNRPGAGGVTGTEQGARAAADGYTLVLGTTSTLLTNPALNPAVRYHAERDFTAIGGMARTSFVVVTANTPEAPHTLAQLLERLRDGRGSFGSAGVGTVTHLASELLLKRTGLAATHAPYRGSSQSLTDVAAGQLTFATDTPVAALPLIRAGRLRALAVTAAERLPSLPAVPTAVESGVPGLRVAAWWGLMAPAGLPPDLTRRLSDALLRTLAAPEVRTQLAGLELEPLALGAPQFAALIAAELPVWTDFVRQLGLKVEF